VPSNKKISLVQYDGKFTIQQLQQPTGMFLNITAADFTGESQPPFQHLQHTDDYSSAAAGQLPDSWPLQQTISLPNNNAVNHHGNGAVEPWLPMAPPTLPAPLRQDNLITAEVAAQANEMSGGKENVDASLQPAPSLEGWAARNPDLDIIPSRQHAQQRGCRVVNDVKKQVNKDARIAFNTAISEAAIEIEQQVKRLAQDHAKTEASVREALVSATHYSQHREPSLQNAKVHDKAQEINKGTHECLRTPRKQVDCCFFEERARGEKLKMIEVRAMMDDDPKYKNLSKEEETELIQNLRNFRENKDLAARASNRAAAADIAATIKQIAREVGPSDCWTR
jgi:hypothetical protein